MNRGGDDYESQWLAGSVTELRCGLWCGAGPRFSVNLRRRAWRSWLHFRPV